MTPLKRLLDLSAALVLSVLLLPVMLIILGLMALRREWPFFYVSERMRAPGRPFGLWKLRTMTPDAGDRGVSGGDKAHRITRTGRMLRRYRLDEIPQLWNVLKGDMSFVGPRPPLRDYVERFPETYAEVLKSRPGITGLATQVYHRHEEMLLARCTTPEETDAVYSRACVPRKATLDMIYQRNRTICFDMLLMWRTFAAMLRRG